MWFCGFSLDNLSLMALTIGTGFVVDDAIVMIENIVRHLEDGEKPLQAALDGAREIGFTVISLTLSLIAVFIPLLFMTGLVGRMFREFALTLTIAVVVSAIVSLTLTPMMCGRAAAASAARRASNWFARAFNWVMEPSSRATGAASNGCCATSARRSRDARRRSSSPSGSTSSSEGLPAVAGHRPITAVTGGRAAGLVRRAEPAAGRGRRAVRKDPAVEASSPSSASAAQPDAQRRRT